MTTPYTLPPLRAVGTPDPPDDMNNTVYALQAAGAVYNVLNAAYAGGADPTGGTDFMAAVNAAISAVPGPGAVVALPPGTYSANGTASVAMATTGVILAGAGAQATIIRVGASFSAAQVIAVTAPFCQVRDLSIVGAVGTVTANPACNGIEITNAAHGKVSDVFMQYVNGWGIESAGTTSTNVDTMFRGITMRNCAGGIHVLAGTATSFLGEIFMTDIQLQAIGATSGPSANLGGLKYTDVTDVVTENVNIGVAAGVNGAAIQVEGACTADYFTNVDAGGGSACVLIADTANGSPSDIRFSNGTFQESTADAGLKVTGGAGGLYFGGIYFHANQTHGVSASNTGQRSILDNCRWNTNGQGGAAGTPYDVSVTGSGKWLLQGGVVGTTVGTASANVANPVNDTHPSVSAFGVSFVGLNTTRANCFTGGGPVYTNACPGYSIPMAAVSFTPPNPSSTAGTTGLIMMGLGSTCTFTPASSGQVLAVASCGVATATAAVIGNVGFRWGSGTIPSNGSAVQGQRWGSVGDIQFKSTGAATTVVPVSANAVLAGTASTAYWADIAIETTVGADVAEVINVGMSFFETS